MAKTSIVPNVSDMAHIKFDPSREQGIVKSQFWSLIKESACLDPYSMSIASITSLVGGSKLEKWLHDPAFRSWFFNQNHTKHKILAAAELAVEALVDVMMSDKEGTEGARVKAAETILRLSGYEPPKIKSIEIADKNINSMSEDQLRQYIDANVKKLGYIKPTLDESIIQSSEVISEILEDDE